MCVHVILLVVTSGRFVKQEQWERSGRTMYVHVMLYKVAVLVVVLAMIFMVVMFVIIKLVVN